MSIKNSDPISVLMISPQFRPLYGGYERAAERLSGALSQAGLRVVVLTARQDRSWPVAETVDGYEIRRVWSWQRRRCQSISTLLSFASFILRHGRGFDVWHVHQYGYHAALSVALGRLLRRPVVLKLTNSAAQGIESTLGSGAIGRILRFFHRRVSACVAVSQETRDEAVVFGIPDHRIHLIPNGLDRDQFRPASVHERADARRMLNLDCEILVLSLGRLSEEKNPLGLLDAWATADRATRSHALLAIVGDGPQREEIQARIRVLGIEESVLLAGRRSDVENWYRAADFYVIASHNEGLSNSMIEALAGGLPVISTRVSGSGVLVESPPAGIVVERDNPLDLARAIDNLSMDASMRAQLGANARNVFEARFLLEAVSNQVRALYGQLLYGPGALKNRT